MSSVEVKHALRKIEFPECAREAIKRIETLINGRSPTIKQMDLAIDLMAEFVFWEKDRRGNKRNTDLSSLQEIQLLEVLCEYFSNSTNEITKNTVFLSLFGPSTIQIRLKILCKLVSLGVSLSCTPLLIAAGAWMQQLSCTSSWSLQLARALIKDYFALIPNVLPTLKTLPKIAPQFTANFLTAIAEIYLSDKHNGFSPPPDSLLTTITEWVAENPNLCLAAQQKSAALPSGGIVMPTITPIAGLFKWCILAPLHYSNPINLVNSKTGEKLTSVDNKLNIYAQLHLALLETLLEVKNNNGLPNTVCSQHLATVIIPVQNYINELVRLGKETQMKLMIQTSLDRLAQAVQVSIAAKCMYGNIQELLLQLEKLPNNRLLNIVINTHKTIPIL